MYVALNMHAIVSIQVYLPGTFKVIGLINGTIISLCKTSRDIYYVFHNTAVHV